MHALIPISRSRQVLPPGVALDQIFSNFYQKIWGVEQIQVISQKFGRLGDILSTVFLLQNIRHLIPPPLSVGSVRDLKLQAIYIYLVCDSSGEAN